MGHTTVLLVLVSIWVVGVGAGVHGLWKYAQQPGGQSALSAWPSGSQMTPPQGKPVLLMFAHPRCPCTRASIRELERLVAQVQGKLNALLVFTKPAGLSEDWSWTELEIGRIEGVDVFADEGGKEAILFEAQTSGLTLFFSDRGELLFQGGITASRGHEGPNDGIAALKRLINNQATPISRTPVYGCPLQSPTPVVSRRKTT